MSSQRPSRGANGSMDAGGRRTGSQNVGGLDQKTRAEMFEDEKKRIIESCFDKKEPDGAFAESYITHIQVEEDGSSPSSPPPPTSSGSNKKSRVIIVAVRRSGRVRLHKARENSNASFSIGKTWLLDHLSAIESFSGGAPSGPEERERKEWGGDTGMLITIQKPYFWKAQSVTEKDFFVGSLVKIYRKYTNGKEPQLSGFTQSELSQIGPLTSQRPKTPQVARQSPMPSPGPRSGGTDFSGSGLPPDTAHLPLRPPSSSAISTRTNDSQDRIPPLPGQFPSEFAPSLRDKGRSRSSQSNSVDMNSRPDMRPPSRDSRPRGLGIEANSSTESFHSSRLNTQTPPTSKANGSFSSLSRSERAEDIPVPGPRSPQRENSARKWGSSGNNDMLPERRRPPLDREKLENYNEDVPSPLSPRKGTKESPQSERKFRSQDANPTESKKVDESPNAIAAALQSTPPASPPEEGEVFRPGLGPMIKKKRSVKQIGDSFRKAATVATAFQPRAGGAAAKLRDDTGKSNDSSDGINGVFKAPIVTKESFRSTPLGTPDSQVQLNPIDSEVAKTDTPPSLRQKSKPEPEVKKETEAPKTPKEPEKTPPPPPEEKKEKKKRPLDNSSRFAEVLGIPVYTLQGRTAHFEALLDDIGWTADDKIKVKTEDLQLACRKELSKAETGTWMSSFEQGDERVAAVSKMLDKAIAECDEFDGLLTLYDAELGTLNEDVGHIEAQSQGLQVETANQRLLYREQKLLLDTISIPSSQLRVLKEGSLDRPDNIASIETSLTQLYRAMLTIDPTLRHRDRAANTDDSKGDHSGSTHKISGEVSGMRAVQEKKDGYRAESVDFILRLKSHMFLLFREAEYSVRQSMEKIRTRPSDNQKIDLRRRDKPRLSMWMYSPLMLFTREIDNMEWDDILKKYEFTMRPPYQDEYRECFSQWKAVARKPTGDEQDILFTNQDKESDSLVGRKLTVKRNKTLRDNPRSSSAEKAQDGKMSAYEAFAGVLYDTTQSIVMEQNFCSDLFHIASNSNADFPDVIGMSPPESRSGGELSGNRQFDPDRNLAKRLQDMMEEIFQFWPIEIQQLVDAIVAQDPIQGVGVLCALESKYTELEDSNQEFVLHVLKQNRDRLQSRFERFVDEQIRGIEDTKVRIKKRKGVIAFIKTFPYFSSTIENMLPSPRTDPFETRDMVNIAYRRLVKAMFESLKFIAKESPVVMAGQKSQGQGGADTEDKEVLNYHILLIENMNHYVEEVDVRNNTVLEESKREASREMREHLNLYLNAVTRRPLGKLLDMVESCEALIATAAAAGDSPTTVANRPSHSKAIFKKVLSGHDAKEVRHGVDSLKKRVDKHFGNADDPGLSRNLVVKVLRECEERYLDLLERTQKIVKDVYEGQLEMEFRKDDVVNAFRK